MTLGNFATGKSVIGDGAGHIYIIDQATGVKTLFPWCGFDPSFAWNGAAIIFADCNRTTAWCANLNGSGLYNLGVTTAPGSVLRKPILAEDLSIYIASVYTPAGYDIYTFGGGGYGLTRIATYCSSFADISDTGDEVLCTGWNGSNWRIYSLTVGQPGATFLPFTSPGAGLIHPVMPCMGPYYSSSREYTCALSDWNNVNDQVPSTYHFPSDIVVGHAGTGTFTRLNVCPSAAGNLVMNSRLTPDSLAVIYDFVTPTGCGVWAVPNKYRNLTGGGAGVYGNPNGGTFQFRSTIGHSVK